eukprot:4295769-Amphidinium_carterae.1
MMPKQSGTVPVNLLCARRRPVKAGMPSRPCGNVPRKEFVSIWKLWSAGKLPKQSGSVPARSWQMSSGAAPVNMFMANQNLSSPEKWLEKPAGKRP